MTDALEKRIAKTLSNGHAGSEDLTELVAEVEAAAVKADTAAQAAREQANDLLASPDGRAAHEAVVVADLRRDRLRAVLPRLHEQLREARVHEYRERWAVDCRRVAAARDALAKEFAEVYPAACAELLDLLRRMAANDRECDRVNAAAPGSAPDRLRSAELVARKLQGFSRDTPAIAERIQLPDWEHSDRTLWPPPQPSVGVTLALGMVAAAQDPRRYSDKWWEVQEEDKQARRAENERMSEYYRRTTKEQEDRQNAEARRK
jgi:hypothetical protein